MKNKIIEKPVSNNNASGSIITFDKKVKIFLIANLIIFSLLVLFKIQGSSTPIWNSFFGIDQKKAKDIVFGQPRGIRQDEWSSWVPNIINQCKSGMKPDNYCLGDGNVGHLHSYLPIVGIKDVFRSKLWGYHLFDIERGYAFDWNLRVFGLIVSSFLFFLIFTNNNFWLSVFGSFWLFLSSGQQWWSNNQGEMLSNMFFLIVSLIMVLYLKTKKEIVLWAIPLLISCASFALVLYPPWQIPMTYLLVSLIVGYIISNWDKEKLFALFSFKILIGIGIVVILLSYIFWILNDAKDAIEMTMNTAYPGKRFITGGDLPVSRLFSEYFGYFITDVNTPPKWQNICEASGYLVFFPFILYTLIKSFFKKHKTDYVLWITSILMLVFMVWMFIGLPTIISKILFLHVVKPIRLLTIFQMASLIITVIYLSKKSDISINKIEIIAIGVVSFIGIYLIGVDLNKSVDGFFKPTQVTLVAIIFSVCYLLLAIPQYKWRNLLFGSIIIMFLLPNIKVNPVSIGLKALLENPIVKQVRPIHNADPNPKWAVFGNVMMANLLKVEGISVFNGGKSTPILSEMKKFDPTGKDNFIYNRAGNINLFSFIDGKDSTVFKLNDDIKVDDTYYLYADPCGAKLKSIGVKYILFTYQPQPAEIRCMKLVSSTVLPVYQILD